MSVNISDKLINLISKKYHTNKEVTLIKFKQELSTRKIDKFTYNLYFKFILILFREFLIFFLKISKLFFSKKIFLSDSSFLLGFPNESIFLKNDVSYFQRFWQEGPLKNFCKNTKILIFTDKKNTNIYSDNFQYYSCYISYLINTLEKKEKINLLKTFIKDLSILIKISFKEQIALIICRDICYLSLFKVISKKQKNLNFFFNANSYSHNIICLNESSKFKTYFCYYSMNNLPVTYSKNSILKISDYNYIYQYLYINYHLIWNDYHELSLKKLGLKYGKFTKTGPYLYYLDDKIISKKSNRVVIFDVEPYKNVSFNDSYYNTDYCIKFLKDILSALNNIKNIEIILKHKIRSRSTIEKYDEKYNNFILENKKYIKIADREENLFSLINSSNLCINFPYTSTATIAKSLGVKSIYYDSTNTLDYQEYGIEIVKGSKELNKFINIFYKNNI